MRDEEDRPVRCHSCSAELKLNTVEALKDKSRTKFVLQPSEGSLMRAETVGGTLTNLSKLIRAIGKQHNVERSLLVEGIRMREDGALEFDLLQCFVPPRKRQRKAKP